MLKSMLFFIVIMIIYFLTPNLFFIDRVTIGKSNEIGIQSLKNNFFDSLLELSNSSSSNNVKKDYSINNTEVPEKIKLLLTSKNEIIELNFDDYIKGVLIGEVPITYELEALKAQAIVARTYTLHKLKSNSEITSHNRG